MGSGATAGAGTRRTATGGPGMGGTGAGGATSGGASNILVTPAAGPPASCGSCRLEMPPHGQACVALLPHPNVM